MSFVSHVTFFLHKKNYKNNIVSFLHLSLPTQFTWGGLTVRNRQFCQHCCNNGSRWETYEASNCKQQWEASYAKYQRWISEFKESFAASRRREIKQGRCTCIISFVANHSNENSYSGTKNFNSKMNYRNKFATKMCLRNLYDSVSLAQVEKKEKW